MHLATRALVRFLRVLPRPATPSAVYLAGLRRELPAPALRLFSGRPARDVSITRRALPLPDGALPARVYRPSRRPETALPMVVNFHGGGFVLGNLGAADWLCGHVAERTGSVVVSVAYRLAPEHPAPAAFDDAWAATRWLLEHATTLGGDPDKVSVMGESAGGNLAALVALAARDLVRADADSRGLARQVLVYPATDLTLASASVAELAEGPLLTRRSLDWYGRMYLPQGLPHSIGYDDPRVSPLLAADHTGLPPALVIAAGRDPLRDDALRYAAALSAAGVDVRTVTYPEAIHGFVALPRFEPAAQQALDEVVDFLSV